MQGKFITIDGTEASGKSTQLTKITEYLNEQGISAYVTREPGGTQIGEFIRNLILSKEYNPDADTELLLIMAARNEHLKKEIIPRLQRGQWIICDRFNDATFAYQGYGRGIPIQRIIQLEQWLSSFTQPDLSILLKLPLKIAENRLINRGFAKDRIESEHASFFDRVSQGYQARATLPHVKQIDASGTIESTFQRIIPFLQNLKK